MIDISGPKEIDVDSFVKCLPGCLCLCLAVGCQISNNFPNRVIFFLTPGASITTTTTTITITITNGLKVRKCYFDLLVNALYCLLKLLI